MQSACVMTHLNKEANLRFTSGIFPVKLSDALEGKLLSLLGNQAAQLYSSPPGAWSDSVSGCWRLQHGGWLTTWGLTP